MGRRKIKIERIFDDRLRQVSKAKKYNFLIGNID